MMHLNVDDAATKPISKQYHVGGIPCVIVFDAKGQEVDRIIGYDNDRSAWLKTLLASLYGIDTIDDLQNQYAAKPSLEMAHTLAQKYLDRGDGQNALLWVDKARTQKPDDKTESQLALIQGQSWLITDPPKGIDALMGLAVKADGPDGIEAFEAVSAYYKRKARNATSPEEKAAAKASRLEVFHKVVAAHPENPDILSEYAWFCTGDGIELDKALAAAQKATELKKDDAETYSVLAEVNFKAGKKEAALAAIDKAIQLGPDESFYKEQKEKFTKTDEAKPKP
jgi:tetratricopeptide (TPR) repeat protein